MRVSIIFTRGTSPILNCTGPYSVAVTPSTFTKLFTDKIKRKQRIGRVSWLKIKFYFCHNIFIYFLKCRLMNRICKKNTIKNTTNYYVTIIYFGMRSSSSAVHRSLVVRPCQIHLTTTISLSFGTFKYL